MSFNVGDRVKIVKASGGDEVYLGREGTVARVINSMGSLSWPWPYDVRLDGEDPDLEFFCDDSEIESV